MNITNSTITEDSKENFVETLSVIGGLVLLCCLYYCYCTPSKEESEKRFKWSVERAKARIALRNELATQV